MNQTQVPDGTLVDLLFPNNPAIADLLKGHGIHTVEQLANLSANAIDSVGMGVQQYVNLANEYLQKATDGSAFLELKRKLADRDQEVRILKALPPEKRVDAIKETNLKRREHAFRVTGIKPKDLGLDE